ncbi:hypothetical protein COU80_01715 [Candidatus Peregrinibacteria bacterium CG10_big_fil_rev_8_21_14_0_10_55_24]|nr:MAG: hypothetical protein COU80_01715 [Candidatus Peregrinibacteria bacterium CG10_big_fil_rev_8_21_14_0_10_55_24]
MQNVPMLRRAGSALLLGAVMLCAGALLNVVHRELRAQSGGDASQEIVIEEITSRNDDGIYGTGSMLFIDVRFSQLVLVETTDGTPSLLLETGENDAAATYIFGSMTETITFRYQVGPGEHTSDLDVHSAQALETNGAVFVAAFSDDPVVKVLPVGTDARSLQTQKDIVVDPSALAAPHITVPEHGAVLHTLRPTIGGESIAVEHVDLYAGTMLMATVAVGTGGTWVYTPQEDWLEGEYVLRAVGVRGEERSAASLPITLFLEVLSAPVVAVTSHVPDGVYPLGSQIDIRVVFENTMFVTGIPQILLETGEEDAFAQYVSGSGTTTLVLRYTVERGHASEDLEYVSTGALVLNGGTITDAAGRTAALTLPEPGSAGSLSALKHIVIAAVPPPAPVITTPLRYANLRTHSITVAGTAQTGSLIVLTEAAGSRLGETTVSDDGTWAIGGVALPNGYYTLRAYAVDPFGNRSDPGDTTITIMVSESQMREGKPYDGPGIISTGTGTYAPLTPIPAEESKLVLPPEGAFCPTYRERTAGVRSGSLQSENTKLMVATTHSMGTVLYEDVRFREWYAANLASLTAAGIVTGSPGTTEGQTVMVRTFRAQESLLSGEFMKFISQAMALPAASKPASNLLVRGHWAEPYAARMEEAGYRTLALSDPERTVTRGLFLQTLVDAIGLPTQPVDQPFYSDVPRDHRFAAAIEVATKYGLFYGDVDANARYLYTARADDAITRAEAVVLLDRALRIFCRIDRPQQLLPSRNRTDRGTELSPLLGEDLTAEYRQEPLHSAAPDQQQACTVLQYGSQRLDHLQGYLRVETTGDPVVFDDVHIGEWYAPSIDTLARAGITWGVQSTQGILPSDFAERNQVILRLRGLEGSMLLGSSEQDQILRAERYDLLLQLQEMRARAVGSGVILRSFLPQDPLRLGDAKELVSSALRDEQFSIDALAFFQQEKHSVQKMLTRAEFINLLMEAFDFAVTAQSATIFQDVPAEHPASGAIAVANQYGILIGNRGEDGAITVRPDDPITRAEAAAFLVRTMILWCSVR